MLTLAMPFLCASSLALAIARCLDRSFHTPEYAGYWESTSFQSDVDQDMEDGKAVTFYDSGWKGHPLFTAPMDRTWDDFLSESKKHGWPSFRDTEVNWDYARVLPGGEMVSVDGSHLVRCVVWCGVV